MALLAVPGLRRRDVRVRTPQAGSMLVELSGRGANAGAVELVRAALDTRIPMGITFDVVAFRALSAGGMHCGDCGWHVGAHASGKPAAVALWQRWACVGVDGELEVVSVDPCGVAPDVCLATPGSAPVVVRARAADMLGLKEWRFLD